MNINGVTLLLKITRKKWHPHNDYLRTNPKDVISGIKKGWLMMETKTGKEIKNLKKVEAILKAMSKKKMRH